MKRGTIAIARSLCMEIEPNEEYDLDGRQYGSVDIAEILSAEIYDLRQRCKELEVEKNICGSGAGCLSKEARIDAAESRCAALKAEIEVQTKAADHWMSEACSEHNLTVKQEAEIARLEGHIKHIGNDALRSENAALKTSRDEYYEAVDRLSVDREEALKDRVALAHENTALRTELAKACPCRVESYIRNPAGVRP